MRRLAKVLLVSTLVASASIALGQNGRPPPIKIGQPAPPPPKQPQPPIKIGKPAGPSSNSDINKMLDVALNTPLKVTTFAWAVGIGDVQMEPTATHICLLTEVAGNFSGSEHVYLRINKNAPGGPRYVLGGASKQAQLKAAATCARKDQFTPGMVSPKFMGFVELPVGIDSGCGPVQYGGMVGDDSAVFIREMAGKFRGGNDGVDLGISSNGSVGMRTSACSGWAGGAVGGITFGGLGPESKWGFGGVVKYYGKNGRTTQTAVATWSVTAESSKPPLGGVFGGDIFTAADDRSKVMVPVNKALCGIVMIRGKFQGFGEFVRISAVNGNWKADSGTQAEPGLVNAAFRCIARDQR